MILLWQVLCQKAGSGEPFVCTGFCLHGYNFSSARRCWSLLLFIGLPMSCLFLHIFSPAWRCPVIEISLTGTGSTLSSAVKFRLGRGNCSLCVGQNPCREGWWGGHWYELNLKSARQKKANATDQTSGAKAVAKPKTKAAQKPRVSKTSSDQDTQLCTVNFELATGKKAVIGKRDRGTWTVKCKFPLCFQRVFSFLFLRTANCQS